MVSTSFYVQLPSNTNVQGNRTCDFIVRLARKLQFNADWSVGLAVIIYPHSWPSIGTNDAQYLRIYWKTPEIFTNNEYYPDLVERLIPNITQINVPKSKHSNSERLEEALNLLLSDQGKKLASDLDKEIETVSTLRISTSIDPNDHSNLLYERLIKHAKFRANCLRSLNRKLIFEYNREYQRFKVYYSNIQDDENVNGNNCISYVEVSQQLAYVIGLENLRLPLSGNYVSYAPDLLGGISSLYVYAPGLIEPVLIGDTTAPLLRIVHVKKNQNDDNVEDIYAAIQYHKLLTKEISEIKIEIRTATGRLIPFEYGNCLLTLHFRKLPYF